MFYILFVYKFLGFIFVYKIFPIHTSYNYGFIIFNKFKITQITKVSIYIEIFCQGVGCCLLLK
jgi:hypothetical protein